MHRTRRPLTITAFAATTVTADSPVAATSPALTARPAAAVGQCRPR